MEGTSLQVFDFHNGSTVISVGEEYTVQNGAEKILIEAKSIGTATIKFEALGKLNEWRPLLGSKNVATVEVITETSDLAPWYEFEIGGYNKIRANVTANSGSPLYVSGKIIR